MLARIRTSLPAHPVTGVRAIGVVNGKPVFPVRGGAPDPEPDPNPAPPAPPTPPAPPAPPAPAPPAPPAPTPPAPPSPPAPAPPADDLTNLPPADLAKMVRDLRSENASARTTAKATAAEEARQELAQTIGKALGLVKDDEPADPAKLTEQLTATQQQAREAAVQLAVYRAAGAHQGDPNALLDSNSFLAKVKDLDPTAADFPAKVDAAIKDAVTTNPLLRASQAPARGGAQFSGGPGGGAEPTTLHDAVAAALAQPRG